MGIFDKIKSFLKKDNKELKVYEKGLEKTRKEFTSKLNLDTLEDGEQFDISVWQRF